MSRSRHGHITATFRPLPSVAQDGGYAGQPKGHAGDVHSHIGKDVKTRLDSETIVRFHNEG